MTSKWSNKVGVDHQPDEDFWVMWSWPPCKRFWSFQLAAQRCEVATCQDSVLSLWEDWMQGGNGLGNPATQKSDCRFSVENATYETWLCFVCGICQDKLYEDDSLDSLNNFLEDEYHRFSSNNILVDLTLLCWRVKNSRGDQKGGDRSSLSNPWVFARYFPSDLKNRWPIYCMFFHLWEGYVNTLKNYLDDSMLVAWSFHPPKTKGMEGPKMMGLGKGGLLY